MSRVNSRSALHDGSTINIIFFFFFLLLLLLLIIIIIFLLFIIIIIIIIFDPLAQSRRLEDIKQVMTANGVYSVLYVPRKATASPLWRAIERRWNKNVDFLGSSVTALVRRPISWTNSMAARWFHAPAVSIATVSLKKIWCFPVFHIWQFLNSLGIIFTEG